MGEQFGRHQFASGAEMGESVCQVYPDSMRIRLGPPCQAALRSWKSGPEKGKPKLSPAAQSMLDRGLIEIRPARIGYTAFLTDTGIAALRLLVLDARAMDPARFGHRREQLGLQTTK
jgi:hypothetical protein